MPSTSFTDKETLIEATWLNEVNDFVFGQVVKKIEDYGGAADGSTDNYQPFIDALADGATIIEFPADGIYYFSAGIVVPEGTAILGGSFLPSNPPSGTRFKFPLTTPVCVDLGGDSASNGSGMLRRVTIYRATGSVGTTTVGLRVKNLYASSIEDVACYRHGIPLQLVAGSYTGITTMLTRIFTGHATDTHVELDTIPESRFSQCRFGINGGGEFGDQNCNSFVRITGGDLVNPASGPNSAVFSNCQFNQGQNEAGAWIDFADQLPGSVTDSRIWQFDACYVETVGVGIRSDSSWSSIDRLNISNVVFNRTVPFFDLDPASAVNNWNIDGLQCFGSASLSPTDQYNFLTINNSFFLGDFTLDYSGTDDGSTATVSDTVAAGTLTFSGSWACLLVRNCMASTGAYAGTPTPSRADAYIELDFWPYSSLRTFVPVLTFGGASTGVTYSTRSGAFKIDGPWVEGQVEITLTSKGSATGIAQIELTGLPDVTLEDYSLGNSGGAAYAINMASLPGHIVGNVGVGPTLNLYTSAATGITPVLDTNFTNTSQVAIPFRYLKA